MKLGITRNTLRITPESQSGSDERDVAFIEAVLKLKKDGDYIKLIRRNAYNLNCMAYLETEVKGE